MKKQRGGQPGNLNAFKHGFYSQTFRDLTEADIEAILAQGLEDEIALLRTLLRKFLDTFGGFETLQDAARTLDIAGITATRLASLLKIQNAIGRGQGDETLQTINKVIEQVNKEFGLEIGG